MVNYTYKSQMVIWKAFPDTMDNPTIYRTSKHYNYCAHLHCNKIIIDFYDCKTHGQNDSEMPKRIMNYNPEGKEERSKVRRTDVNDMRKGRIRNS